MFRKNLGIDEKVLIRILKRFLVNRKSDPDVYKYFKMSDGVDFCATSGGVASSIYLKNKIDYRDGETRFLRPLPKGKYDIKDNIKDYPDFNSLFDGCEELSHYIEVDLIDELIHIHEAMDKVKSLGGRYYSSKITIFEDVMNFKNQNGKALINCNIDVDTSNAMEGFTMTYDTKMMIPILKAIKDLKLESFRIHFPESSNDMIFIIGEDRAYSYRFALARLLVGEGD